MGRLKVIAVSLAVLLALTHNAVAADSESPRNVAAAESFFRTGVEAFKAGDYQVALQSLERAFELHVSFRTATVLAQVELELKRFTDSAAHIDVALKLLPRGEAPDARRKLLQALKQARSRVATVGFRPNVSSALLYVDGRLLANGQVVHDLYLKPGVHSVEVRAQQYISYSRQITFSAGSQRELIVNLVERHPRASRPVDDNSQVKRTVLLVGASLSLLGLGVGTYGLVGASSASDSEEKKRFGDLALYGFGATAVIAAATGVTYFLVGSETETESAALSLSIGPFGLTARGTF